jgi:hypothetical protein
MSESKWYPGKFLGDQGLFELRRRGFLRGVERSSYRTSPLEKALEILPRYYACGDPKGALTWYFGKDWDILVETSFIISDDWDDAVAWELHELVEACEYRRLYPSPESPDWTSPEFLTRKRLPHEKALQVELTYFRDIKRFDLLKKREESLR